MEKIFNYWKIIDLLRLFQEEVSRSLMARTYKRANGADENQYEHRCKHGRLCWRCPRSARHKPNATIINPIGS